MSGVLYRHTNGTTTQAGETCGRLDCLCALNAESRTMAKDVVRAMAGPAVKESVLGKGMPMLTQCQLCTWKDSWTDWGPGYRAAAEMRADGHLKTVHPNEAGQYTGWVPLETNGERVLRKLK